MVKPTYTEQFVSISHTATDDLKFSLVGADLWLEDVNIHCETKAAKYGSRSEQEAVVYADDVLSYRYINLKDIFFKNETAAANTVIRAIGVVMPPDRIKRYGIPLVL